MVYPSGPQTRIVLVLKEGNGFTFLVTKLIAVATLKDIKIETEQFQPSSRPQFNSELIWDVNSKYLRKLRSANTALKIEFYTITPHSDKRERIGYVLLNLKEAEIDKFSDGKVSESWHRLLNVKSIHQIHKPEVLLSFKILEFPYMNFMSTDDDKEDPKLTSKLGQGDNGCIGAPDAMPRNHMLNPLQIGPPALCTELYELSISFIKVENLSHITPVEKIGQPIKIHFAIFGQSVWINDISPLEKDDNAERINFQIWSKVDFISAYFKEFSSLVLTIYCEQEVIGICSLNLQHLGNNSVKKNTAINSCITIKPQAEYENISDMLLPTLQVSVTLLNQKDCVTMCHDQESQTLNIQPLLKIDAVTNTEFEDKFNSAKSVIDNTEKSNSKENVVPEDDTEHDSLSNRSFVIPERHRNSPRTSKLPLTEQADSILQSRPPMFRLSNASCQVPDFPKEYIRDAALKACEELEDWKEKQQEMFEFELKKKCERRLKKLSSEWLKHKEALEHELQTKIDECQSLKERLTVALDDLNRRTELVVEKERELQQAQDELDKKYTQKFQELRKASKLHEYDMEDRINEIKSENSELMRKLEQSRKEILRLQEALLHRDNPLITKEDASSLLNEVKSLEQKLGKALESKAFFKEQWGKAVRELHRMKEIEQQQLKQQIQKNKQELQTLGLVKEISQEVTEMKKDQNAIRNLRSNLSNFISSSNPVDDVNCFSGT